MPLTQRMLLRPPLRTNARVVWEASQELPDHARWHQDGVLDPTKLLNPIDDFDRLKTYEGLFKCQVLGFEMLLRSGFRVRMHRYVKDGQVHLYYYRVNRLAREARDVKGMTSQKPGVLGYQGEASWGRRWDLKLMALPAAQQPVEINRMIDEEGRAFYLVREFEGKPGHRTPATCCSSSACTRRCPRTGIRGSLRSPWSGRRWARRRELEARRSGFS